MAGQGTSLIGTWMQNVALAWYVFRLTGSSTLLGFISLMSLPPTLIVAPMAGVLVDRLNKRNVIVATQSLALLQATVLAVLVLTGTAQVWHIVVLSLVLGIVNAMDTPSRQAFIIEIVDDRSHLPNAIALNSSMFNLARILGPSIAGVIMRLVGVGMCFLINAVSYVAVIAALLAMRLRRREPATAPRDARRELKEGAVHAFSSVPIRSILAFLALMNFCSGAYVVLLPAYASKVFHGNETTYTSLYIAVGCGAIAAAVTLASRASVRGLSRVLVLAALTFSTCLVLIGIAPSFWFAMPLLAGVGFGMMTHMASCNTLVQTVVDDQYRGRVMSFYAMSFMLTAPIGSQLAGAAADLLGPRWVMVQFGLLGILGALVFFRGLPTIRAALRPVYEEKGIIPIGK